MTTCLDDMPNAFEEVNRVRCFNHTLQLSAKALLKPFNASTSSNPTEGESSNGIGDGDDIYLDELKDDDTTSTGDEPGLRDEDDEDDEDDDDELDEDQRAELMKETANVRAIVSKVCLVSLALTHCSHCSRFDNLLSQSSIPPPLRYQPGVKCVSISISSQDSFPETSSPAGTRRMTC
jgi:hypothetical protein